MEKLILASPIATQYGVSASLAEIASVQVDLDLMTLRFGVFLYAAHGAQPLGSESVVVPIDEKTITELQTVYVPAVMAALGQIAANANE